jgi:hypothetical protein
VTDDQKTQAVADKLRDVKTCPNCMQPITKRMPGCVLHDLIGIVSDRGNVNRERLHEIHAACDPLVMWEDLGPVIDKLEAGGYST